MKNALHKIALVVFVSALIAAGVSIVHAPRNSSAPASADEIRSRLFRSIRSADWEGIDAAASEWMHFSPNYEEAARLRGYAALALGRVGEAEAHFIRSGFSVAAPKQKGGSSLLAGGEADTPIGLLLAADRAAQSGDEQGARERVSRAIEAAPSLSVARIFRASLETRANQFSSALEDLAAVGDAEPTAKEARLLRILIYLSQGRNETARSELAALVESVPAQPLAFNTLGILCALDQKWPEAADAFAKAHALVPQFSDAKRNWSLAQAAASAPGTVLALRSELQDANYRAMAANSQELNHSISAAWATSWEDTFHELAPYANAASNYGAMTKNPELAVGGKFAADEFNLLGNRAQQLADQNNMATANADRVWQQTILNIMSVGATRFQNSPQAQAYANRLSRLTVSPAFPTSSTPFGNTSSGNPGGVSTELTEFTRDSSGNVLFKKSDGASRQLAVIYPIFGNW